MLDHMIATMTILADILLITLIIAFVSRIVASVCAILNEVDIRRTRTVRATARHSGLVDKEAFDSSWMDADAWSDGNG